MILLDVSFGIFAFLPMGWVFMIIIVAIECLGLSYIMTKKWVDRKLYNTAILSNFTSGLIGIIGSIILNGGWWLVVWLPWVSKNEVSGSEAFLWFAIYYVIAFILSLLIEGLINYLRLKKIYPAKLILKSTLIVNILSYAFGSVVMYTISFW